MRTSAEHIRELVTRRDPAQSPSRKLPGVLSEAGGEGASRRRPWLRPPARAAAPTGTCSSRLRPAGRRGRGSPGGSRTTLLGAGGAGRRRRAQPRLSPTARNPSPALSRADLGRRCRRGSRHSLRPGSGRRGPRRKLRAEAEPRNGAPGEANGEDRRTDRRLCESARRGVGRPRGRGAKTRAPTTLVSGCARPGGPGAQDFVRRSRGPPTTPGLLPSPRPPTPVPCTWSLSPPSGTRSFGLRIDLPVLVPFNY